MAGDTDLTAALQRVAAGEQELGAVIVVVWRSASGERVLELERLIPIDVFAFAEKEKPRDFLPGERTQYELD